MSSQLIDSAKDYFTKNGQEVLFAGEVEKYHDKKDGHAPRVLVFGEFQIAYFKGKSQAEFNRTFFHVDLVSIDYNKEQNLITLMFKPESGKKEQRRCKFSTPKAEELVQIMANYLVRVLPAYQCEKTGVKELSNSGKTTSTISVLKRLESYKLSRNVKIDQEIYALVTKIIKYRQSRAVVPDTAAEKKACSIALAALQNDPYIEELVLAPEDKVGAFVSFSRIPDGYSPFKHVTLDQPYSTELLQMLLTMIERKGKFDTDGFTLRNTEMNADEVAKFGKYFDAPAEGKDVFEKKFESLVFDNAIKEDAFESFNEHVLTPYVLSDLKVLGVNKLSSVKIEDILQKAEKLVAVSFANGDLEISDAIREVSKAAPQTLKAISLAGNKCTKPTSTVDISVPEFIEKIDISGCSFDDGQLVSFIRFLLRTKYTNGLVLNASGIKCSQDELKRTLEFMGSLSHIPLVGLNWSNNEVPREFCNLLENTFALRELYLNNCLAAEDETLIEQLAASLEKCTQLKKFMMVGGEKKVGVKIVPILKALKSLPEFEWLDVADQAIDEPALDEISEIIKERELQFLDFDGSAPQTKEPIEKIINLVETESRPIIISYPVKDAAALTMDEAKLITKLSIFGKEDREEFVQDDPFTQPFDTFVHQCELETEFPTFMSKTFIKELENAKEVEYPPEELKSPKKGGKESSSSSSSYSLENDSERERKQIERRNFYLDVDDLGSTTTGAGEKSESEKELQPQITEEGYKEPDWEAFNPEILVPFDNEAALAKNQKKYSLSILREAIQ